MKLSLIGLIGLLALSLALSVPTRGGGDEAVDVILEWNAVALEAIADMAWRTLTIAPDAVDIPSHLLDRHFLRKHGDDAYYGQD